MADIIAVSALNKYVRSVLESDVVLTDIAIRGEISNFSRNHKTGHCYFSLKDAKASVKAVMFRGNADALPFSPQNGMQVVARGRITLYERDGAFQINVEFLFPEGAGAAQMAFEQLKEKLNSEGLFAPEAKKPLPAWPHCIGLVTSKTGAALQDILQVAQRRCPVARFLLAPASVQGQRAPQEICQAIRRLDETDEVDVIIVARGGGSAEDLWVFNDESLVRAAFACRTPIISAVGHEIDFTMLDFVADFRAPTPSAAAELALPDKEEISRQLMHILANIGNNIQFHWDSCYNNFDRLRHHPSMETSKKRCANGAASLTQIGESLHKLQANRMQNITRRLAAAAALAAGLNPYAVLARGYGVVQQNGHYIQSVADVALQKPLAVQLHDGRVLCKAEAVEEGRAEIG